MFLKGSDYMNLRKKIEEMKNCIEKDNYANRNYEICCSYLESIKLRIQDKERGEDNHYTVMMCPPKTPNIDSYLICSKQHNDYAIQIKQGKNKDKESKNRMWHNKYKNIMNTDNYLYLTYQKEPDRISYNSQWHVQEDNTVETIQYIEKRKQDNPKEYKFLKKMMENLAFSNANEDEMDWILLNRFYAHLFQNN